MKLYKNYLLPLPLSTELRRATKPSIIFNHQIEGPREEAILKKIRFEILRKEARLPKILMPLGVRSKCRVQQQRKHARPGSV